MTCLFGWLIGITVISCDRHNWTTVFARFDSDFVIPSLIGTAACVAIAKLMHPSRWITQLLLLLYISISISTMAELLTVPCRGWMYVMNQAKGVVHQSMSFKFHFDLAPLELAIAWPHIVDLDPDSLPLRTVGTYVLYSCKVLLKTRLHFS